MMQIPFGSLKSYFNGITPVKRKKISNLKFIDKEFKSTISYRLKQIMRKFENVELTNKKIEKIIQTKKPNGSNDSSKNFKNVLNNIQNFGIDIALREEFFGDKIQEKHLKIRKSKHNDEDLKKHIKKISLISLKKPKKHEYKDILKNKIRDSAKNTDPNIRKIIQKNKSYLNKLNLKDLQFISNLKNSESFSKIHSDDLSMLKSKLLYSFRDDTTIGNKTDMAEEYDLIKVNSKSIFDLSNINWSISNMTKTQSIGAMLSSINAKNLLKNNHYCSGELKISKHKMSYDEYDVNSYNIFSKQQNLSSFDIKRNIKNDKEQTDLQEPNTINKEYKGIDMGYKFEKSFEIDNSIHFENIYENKNFNFKKKTNDNETKNELLSDDENMNKSNDPSKVKNSEDTLQSKILKFSKKSIRRSNANRTENNLMKKNGLNSNSHLQHRMKKNSKFIKSNFKFIKGRKMIRNTVGSTFCRASTPIFNRKPKQKTNNFPQTNEANQNKGNKRVWTKKFKFAKLKSNIN
jgi:hypothetical protein